MSMMQLVELFLLGFLAVTAVAVLRGRDLFAVVMLFSIYNLVSASLFLILDAADVAFTEAAVGAGISTLLMLATLSFTGREEHPARSRNLLALVLVIFTGAALAYGIADLPPFGAEDNPAHRHVAPRYLEQSPEEVGVANVVTAVLASYRGFDTLGEVVVIFTAGIGVLLLIGRWPGERDR
ncbi:MAG TPA: DUF4040 domain-containing protein [Xanthomonadaceae bacterium]|nr:DUF4040 domain-containing protein [Xanthomonadaceae bacterium]